MAAPRIKVTAEGGTTSRTMAQHVGDPVNVLSFGAVADWNGTTGTNNTAAFNAAATYAASKGRILYVPVGDFYCATAVTVPGGAAGIRMDGRIISPGGFVALTLGDSGSTRNALKTYGPIRVYRATQSDWASEADVGVRIYNADSCLIDIAQVERFTIGVQTYGDDRGFEDSTVMLGRLVDNKIGLDVRTGTANGWNNAIRYIGGHFANSTSTNSGVARYGVRLSREAGAYTLHNSHEFIGPSFELQTTGGATAIPFRLEVDGRALHAIGMRMEACSPYVCEVTSAFNDAYFEPAYVGTYGPYVSALYTGATRSGVSIRRQQQTLNANESPRLIAAQENVRAAAFVDVHQAASGVGFEKMALMSSNPAGGVSTLNTLTFSGLALLTMNSDDITIPTSRALGFVLDMKCPATDAGLPKELVIAPEGTELRPVVVQYDASENVLDNTSPLLFSNANAVWNGSPSYWWETNANLDQTSGGYPLFAWQRVTLHSNCRFVFVGVRGGSATAVLKALRVYANPLLAPQVLYGAGRDWGTREIQTSTTWTLSALAAGATTTLDVTLNGVRGGDFVQAGFSKDSGFQNGGVVFHAVQGGTGSTNQVRVTAQNVSGGSITVGSGTLYVRATRPKR